MREIGESEKKIALRLYIEIMSLVGSKGVERCQALILDRWSYRGAIERYPQQSDLDGSRSYQASIEHTKTFLMDRKAIKKLSRQILKNFNGSKLQ